MLVIVSLYLLLGVGFGLWFFVRGHAALDDTAAGAGWPTRLLWVPAAIVLWPVLLKRSMTSVQTEEQS